jgi:hypothetical protein
MRGMQAGELHDQGCIRTTSATRTPLNSMHSPSESKFSLALCLPCTTCTTTHALHDSKITENNRAHVLVAVMGWAAIKSHNRPTTARVHKEPAGSARILNMCAYC